MYIMLKKNDDGINIKYIVNISIILFHNISYT